MSFLCFICDESRAVYPMTEGLDQVIGYLSLQKDIDKNFATNVFNFFKANNLPVATYLSYNSYRANKPPTRPPVSPAKPQSSRSSEVKSPNLSWSMSPSPKLANPPLSRVANGSGSGSSPIAYVDEVYKFDETDIAGYSYESLLEWFRDDERDQYVYLHFSTLGVRISGSLIINKKSESESESFDVVGSFFRWNQKKEMAPLLKAMSEWE